MCSVWVVSNLRAVFYRERVVSFVFIWRFYFEKFVFFGKGVLDRELVEDVLRVGGFLVLRGVVFWGVSWYLVEFIVFIFWVVFVVVLFGVEFVEFGRNLNYRKSKYIGVIL